MLASSTPGQLACKLRPTQRDADSCTVLYCKSRSAHSQLSVCCTANSQLPLQGVGADCGAGGNQGHVHRLHRLHLCPGGREAGPAAHQGGLAVATTCTPVIVPHSVHGVALGPSCGQELGLQRAHPGMLKMRQSWAAHNRRLSLFAPVCMGLWSGPLMHAAPRYQDAIFSTMGPPPTHHHTCSTLMRRASTPGRRWWRTACASASCCLPPRDAAQHPAARRPQQPAARLLQAVVTAGPVGSQRQLLPASAWRCAPGTSAALEPFVLGTTTSSLQAATEQVAAPCRRPFADTTAMNGP